MATSALLLALCAVYGAHSYVLLSASLDDVHTLAQQIAASPVAGALIRRASTIFKQEMHARNGDKYRNFRKSHQSSEETAEDHEIHNRIHLKQENPSGEHQHGTKPAPDTIEDHKISQNMDEPGVTLKENQDQESPEHPHVSEASDKDDDHQEPIEQNKANGNHKDHDVDLKLSKTQELVALGKNASLYLNDIKKIIEKV